VAQQSSRTQLKQIASDVKSWPLHMRTSTSASNATRKIDSKPNANESKK